jgi:hypothetical protein
MKRTREHAQYLNKVVAASFTSLSLSLSLSLTHTHTNSFPCSHLISRTLHITKTKPQNQITGTKSLRLKCQFSIEKSLLTAGIEPGSSLSIGETAIKIATLNLQIMKEKIIIYVREKEREFAHATAVQRRHGFVACAALSVRRQGLAREKKERKCVHSLRVRPQQW